MLKSIIVILIVSIFFGLVSSAQEIEYPELQVVPRATERLNQEALQQARFLTNWTYLVSGSLTLSTGLKQNNTPIGLNPTQDEIDEATKSTRMNLAVGGLTLAVGLFFSFNDSHEQALTNIKKMKSSEKVSDKGVDKKTDLARERAAEEALEAHSKIHSSLLPLIVVSNLAASIYALNSGNNNTRSQATLAFAGSLLPWIFPHRSVVAWDKHREYKRKIYSPIASLSSVPVQGGLYSQVSLNWSLE